jgi:hypothetical protein
LVPKQADPDEGIGFCNFGFKFSSFLFIYLLFFLILTCSYAIQAQHEMRGGMEKVEKKHEKRESHARWLEKRKAKGNKKL